VSLDFLPGGSRVVMRNAAHALLTATDPATVFVWARNRGGAEWNTGTPVFVPVLDAAIPAPLTVRFTADAIQAGDAFTALSLVVARLVPVE
jgi:hypothetical protein